jgi:hypothetical protein
MEALFSTTKSFEFFSKSLKDAKAEIDRLNDESIAKLDNKTLDSIVAKNAVKPVKLELSDDKVIKTMKEQDVPVDMNRGEFSRSGSKTVQIITFTIPYTGIAICFI